MIKVFLGSHPRPCSLSYIWGVAANPNNAWGPSPLGSKGGNSSFNPPDYIYRRLAVSVCQGFDLWDTWWVHGEAQREELPEVLQFGHLIVVEFVQGFIGVGRPSALGRQYVMFGSPVPARPPCTGKFTAYIVNPTQEPSTTCSTWHRGRMGKGARRWAKRRAGPPHAVVNRIYK